MTALVLYKLLAIVATIGVGWLAMRRGWLAPKGIDHEVATQLLGNFTMFLFVPALLFRTIVRQDLDALPWRILAAYFVPAVLYLLVVYTWQRLRDPARLVQAATGAEPATRTMAVTYGNAVQLGIPFAAALFGEAGLALHIALVSLHGVALLTLMTALVESDLARGQANASRWATLRMTARNTLIHPVVLPVLAALLWNFTGLGLHPVADQTLQTLGQAAVPMALVLIGASLASHGVQGHLGPAWRLVAVKLLLLPAVVLLAAHQLFGLRGLPLQVLVMMAALPSGTNAVIFAQRYKTLVPEVSVAVVLGTLAFVATAGFWLAVLGWVG